MWSICIYAANTPIVANDSEKEKQKKIIKIASDYQYSVSGLTVFYEIPSLSDTDTLNYVWDFGDGTVTNTTNGEHTYATMGYYETCLTIVQPITEKILQQKCKYIEILDPNLCDVVWMPVCGCDNQTYMNECFAANYHGVYYWTEGTCTHTDFNLLVSFTYAEQGDTMQFMNTSVGNYDSYSWDFGDGHISERRNPVYVFQESGNYTVCLTVSSMITQRVETQCEEVIVRMVEE